MAYTYTRTYTKQECEILDLKERFYQKIKAAVQNPESGIYMKIDENGKASNVAQRNLVERGVFVGPDYLVRKGFGLVDEFGTDLPFEYFDEEGHIVSLSEDLGNTTVQLKDQDKVELFDFAAHPEVESYLQQVRRRVSGEYTEQKTAEAAK